MSFELQKKTYARGLACFEAAGIDGLNHRTFTESMKEKFDKPCLPISVERVFETLAQVGFIEKLDGTNCYVITEKGHLELKAIKDQKPERLLRSSSPGIPMHV